MAGRGIGLGLAAGVGSRRTRAASVATTTAATARAATKGHWVGLVLGHQRILFDRGKDSPNSAWRMGAVRGGRKTIRSGQGLAVQTYDGLATVIRSLRVRNGGRVTPLFTRDKFISGADAVRLEGGA